jgi:hypothetical protein
MLQSYYYILHGLIDLNCQGKYKFLKISLLLPVKSQSETKTQDVTWISFLLYAVKSLDLEINPVYFPFRKTGRFHAPLS